MVKGLQQLVVVMIGCSKVQFSLPDFESGPSWAGDAKPIAITPSAYIVAPETKDQL